MGIHNVGHTGALFTETQQRVLGLLYGNVERSYYVNEILRHANVGIGSVQRELARLEASGLVTVSRVGNQKHYQANSESPIFEELRSIVIKTFGLNDVMREALSPINEHIDLAFIYGSIAKGNADANSDVDLMLLLAETSNISYPDVLELLESAESRLGRPVNPTIYKPDEFRQKLKNGNAFIKRVLEQPKIMVKGSENDIERVCEPGKSQAT